MCYVALPVCCRVRERESTFYVLCFMYDGAIDMRRDVRGKSPPDAIIQSNLNLVSTCSHYINMATVSQRKHRREQDHHETTKVCRLNIWIQSEGSDPPSRRFGPLLS